MMRSGSSTSWIPPLLLLAAVLATSGARAMLSADVDDHGWLHASVLAAAVAQAAWLCWLSIGTGLVPHDERPATWRERDSARLVVAAILSGAALVSTMLALQRSQPPALGVAMCVVAGAASCLAAFAVVRFGLSLHRLRKHRARQARKAKAKAAAAGKGASAAADAASSSRSEAPIAGAIVPSAAGSPVELR